MVGDIRERVLPDCGAGNWKGVMAVSVEPNELNKTTPTVAAIISYSALLLILTGVCAQTIHALRILRSHGMCTHRGSSARLRVSHHCQTSIRRKCLVAICFCNRLLTPTRDHQTRRPFWTVRLSHPNCGWTGWVCWWNTFQTCYNTPKPCTVSVASSATYHSSEPSSWTLRQNTTGVPDKQTRLYNSNFIIRICLKMVIRLMYLFYLILCFYTQLSQTFPYFICSVEFYQLWN